MEKSIKKNHFSFKMQALENPKEKKENNESKEK